MLTTQALTEITYEITYKPEWTLTVYEYNDLEGPYLFINTWQTNAFNPEGDKVELRIASPIPPMRTILDYVEWVMWRLKMVEIHEVMEWFKYQDKRYIDPHAPK